MILGTFSVLFSVGFITWLAGDFFDYKSIAIIGAGIIIIAGSGIALTGLEVRSGEVQTNTSASTTEIEYQYQETALGGVFGPTWLAELGLGGLVMLLGAVMLSRTLNSFHQ